LKFKEKLKFYKKKIINVSDPWFGHTNNDLKGFN